MLPRSANSPTSAIAVNFARKVATTRMVWTVAGEDGLARTPSSVRPGREVTLCWSSAEAAERWGRRMARHSRVNPILLGNFVADVLPKLQALNRLVSPDWSADPYHPQVEPSQLGQWLKAESQDRFIGEAQRRGCVFILETDVGPAFAASNQGGARQVLPLWTREDDAAQNIRGFWSEMVVSDIPLGALAGKLLPFVAGVGRGVSLDYGMGGIAVELGAMDLAQRVARVSSLRRSA